MFILYALFRVFTFITSRFPFPVLYFCADLLKFFLQYVIRYRRKVVLNNLANSFPGKSSAEINKIVSAFYRNLAEVIMEVIKLETISKESLLNRFSFKGMDILEEAFKKEKSVIIAIGHYGNWEWMGTALGLVLPVKGYAIIKPLSEKRFHDYLESLRHRLNPDSTIDFHHTYRNLVRNSKSMVTFNVFAADQTPTRSDINHWSPFLNQETAFFTGIEKLSKSLDFTVVFMEIYRTGRGKYVGEITLITDDPKSTADFEITDNYIHLLENSIVKRPDNWLWSHRRWKFTRSNSPS